MKCLENFIKFRAFCKDEESEPSISELYYEDLAALSVVNVADLTGSKFLNHVDLVKQKTRFAAEQVITLALDLDRTFRWKDAVKFYEAGIFTSTYQTGFTGQGGISISRYDNTSTFTQIEAVKGLVDFTGTRNIIVATGNLLNPTSITTYPVTVTSKNEFRLDLNLRVDEPQVHIYWELDEPVNKSYLYQLHGTFGDCVCNDHHSCEYASVTGFNKNGTTVVKGSNTFGLEVEFSIRCDKERFFCRIADILKYAVLYKSGAEILKEAGFSERMNFLTLYKELEIKTTIRDYEKESQSHMEITMDQIRDYIRSIHCPCFDCRGTQLGLNIP